VMAIKMTKSIMAVKSTMDILVLTATEQIETIKARVWTNGQPAVRYSQILAISALL